MLTSSGSRASTSQSRSALADRLRQVRALHYGDQGGPALAQQLGIPAQSWANFEAGVTIPGEVLLCFIVLTGTEPRWLLDGGGPCFGPAGDGMAAGTAEGGLAGSA